MFTFENKEYNSKAEVVREMYDDGDLTMLPDSKKAAAELLEMTVQTVHATLVKYINGNAKKKVIKKKTPVKKTTKKPTKKTTKKKATKRKRKGKTLILVAPNKYGLPVCNPPLEVTSKDIMKEK